MFVRQSSPYQVLHNLESQKLQYAMEERLRHLGWRAIEVVDEDLGSTPSGKSMWKRPVYRSMHRMLTSPVYGGAYAYGKTEHLTGYEGVRARPICRRKPREQWLALIPGTHEGYVSWEEFEQIQRVVQNMTAAVAARSIIGPSDCRPAGRHTHHYPTGPQRNTGQAGRLAGRV